MRHIIDIGIIIALTYIVYWRSIFHHYVCDDLSRYADIKDRERPKKFLTRLRRAFSDHYYDDAPVAKTEHPTCKLTHILSIGLHAATSALIYIAFGHDTVSFIAAILFVLNPFNQEIPLWLSGKGYGKVAVLTLLSYAMPYLTPVFYGGVFFLISNALYGFAVSIVPSTLMFITYPWWCKPFILIAPLLLYSFYWEHIFQVGKIKHFCNKPVATTINWRKLIIWTKFYGYYLSDCILCFKLAQFHGYLSEYTISLKETEDAYKLDKFFWVGAITLFILVTNLIWNYGGLYGPVWGLLWFTVMIAPFCNFVNVGNMLVGMRYAYLANAGLMLTLANFVFFFPPLGIIMGWYLGRLPQVIQSYRNDFWNTEFQIFEEPDYHHSWLLHGNMNYARRNFRSALQDYIEARKCYQNSWKVWFNISSCFILLGNLAEAIKAYEHTKECDLLGQEETKRSASEEREKLIATVYMAARDKKEIKLRINDVPIMV